MTNLEFYKDEINDIRISFYSQETSAAEDLGHALLDVLDKYGSATDNILDWLCAEHRTLTEEERDYFGSIIKPFKDRVKSINKDETGVGTEYITVVYKPINGGNGCLFALPEFIAGTLYRGMELNKAYTLKELDL